MRASPLSKLGTFSASRAVSSSLSSVRTRSSTTSAPRKREVRSSAKRERGWPTTPMLSVVRGGGGGVLVHADADAASAMTRRSGRILVRARRPQTLARALPRDAIRARRRDLDHNAVADRDAVALQRTQAQEAARVIRGADVRARRAPGGGTLIDAGRKRAHE